jgi:hypothetical protein
MRNALVIEFILLFNFFLGAITRPSVLRVETTFSK